MPSADPGTDPGSDFGINGNYSEPLTYFINDELYRMISLARQAPGIFLVSNEEADDEEE